MERILEIIRLNINIARSPPRAEAEALRATARSEEGRNPASIQPGQSPSPAQQHGSSAVGGAAAGGSQAGSGGAGGTSGLGGPQGLGGPRAEGRGPGGGLQYKYLSWNQRFGGLYSYCPSFHGPSILT
ncbi:hypothetical protein CaCOL14_012623 [Colletotrichum acutatum]